MAIVDSQESRIAVGLQADNLHARSTSHGIRPLQTRRRPIATRHKPKPTGRPLAPNTSLLPLVPRLHPSNSTETRWGGNLAGRLRACQAPRTVLKQPNHLRRANQQLGEGAAASSRCRRSDRAFPGSYSGAPSRQARSSGQGDSRAAIVTPASANDWLVLRSVYMIRFDRV